MATAAWPAWAGACALRHAPTSIARAAQSGAAAIARIECRIMCLRFRGASDM